MKIHFCPYNKEDANAIKEVLETVFTIEDYNRIEQVYSTFKLNFNGTPAQKETISKEVLKPNTEQASLLETFANSDYIAGIDLPTLLCPESRGEQTVFIVAEDPLRNETNVEIILSTPFGTHLPAQRTGRLKVYWQFIEYLIGKGVNVYTTDVFKLWLKKNDSKKEYFSGDFEQRFYQALQKEISFFKPQIIISFGNVAGRLSQQINTDANKLYFPHPTGTANRKWKTILQQSSNDIKCTAEEKVKYMAGKIDTLLDK